VIIKGFRFIMLVKSVIIIYVINLQYISVIRVVNVNCRCYSCGVWNGGSGALFFLFFYLPLYVLFLLNLFLKLR